MAEESSAADEAQAAVTQLTFNVKSSSDAKHVVTVPETMTVLELKTKLSTSEFADVPAERQRLIYSGRVLKDSDPLSTYKIKDGNTVHMVKGAASNQRQNPASQGSTTTSSQSNPTAAGVPQNIATGTGNDPLAGLTGARYAGFAQLPGAGQFGPDGGMGPPQSPDEMLRMLENPMFQSQMNEAMNNPHVIQMMQNMPMMRNQPWMRQMLENPEMRRMMMDPQVIRQSIQMSRMMGGMGGMGGLGGQPSMPAPGVTDTTPQQENQDRAAGGQTDTNTNNPTSPPPNPFGMFGQPGAGGPQGNPFAALFGGNPAFNPAGSFNPSATPNTSSPPPSSTGSAPQDPAQNQQSPPPNPFASMFGNPADPNQQQNPMAAMTQQMMQNPEMLRMAMQSMGLGADGTQGAGMGAGMGAGGFNPFAFGQQQQQPAAPADTRPPEEQYADQLRQLNEMGFFEFERNVRALRMSGGSVQGAVEVLLSGTI